MILHHVTQGARGFVVTGATFHAECFCRRNLHMVDVVRVPEGREIALAKRSTRMFCAVSFPRK